VSALAPGQHPWRLVAPWYYWGRQVRAGVAATPRQTRPAIQKFDRPNFVDGFIRDPQRSLKFNDDDLVYTYALVPSPLISSGPFAGKSSALFAPIEGGVLRPKVGVRTNTFIRKLFLDVHRRYYGVVCELHCDAPGFPRVTFDQVCQAGFAVRRRLMRYAKEAEPEARALLRKISAVQERLGDLDLTRPLKRSAASKRAALVRRMKEDGSFDGARAEAVAELKALRESLLKWKDEHGAAVVEEGWVNGPFDQVGEWQVMEERPEVLTEATFPLYPLHENPDLADHDARGRSLYFGVIPTAALETDARGTPRFDDRSAYVIRCFVRRHRPECPRSFAAAPDCPGPLTWSEPTEIFKLASHFDLVGTSQRPFTIQMPDLAELAALAQPGAVAKYAPMRVEQKQSLVPRLSGTALQGKGSVSGPQVCFIAFPLFVLVGYFLFSLFLPIVVFVFGLWFLLAFKLCILPSFSIDLGLQAEIDAALDLNLSGGVDASFSIANPSPPPPLLTETVLNTDLQSGLKVNLAAAEGIDPAAVDLSPYSNKPLVALHDTFRAGEAIGKQAAAGEPVGLDLTASLEYEARIPAPEVAA
jgi:hypothetical protein